MLRAWLMDTSDADQREPHMTEPPQFLSLDDVMKNTGIVYYKINADDYMNDEQLQEIRKKNGYSYEDQVTLHKDIPDYLKMIKMFFEEHIHTDDEIRLIIDGSGYFDARDHQDRWIRMEMQKGDMIVLPAGIYHRFTLDTKDYVKANRYFIGNPVWTAIPRPCEEHPARKAYVKRSTAA